METAGDELPVSAFPVDGTFPTPAQQDGKNAISPRNSSVGYHHMYSMWEMRNGLPHSVIRIKVHDGKLLASAPETFKATDARDKEWAGMKYTIQVAPEDCTGCGICVDICPAKNKTETRLKAINMVPQPALRGRAR